ncbi:hypothetical protein GCM10025865_32120 [Paraoerskovia sediminicola]|uniref:tRNA pseudouridine55 synthase n=1 Tax=Paraoerskovia sediminicola TaxID=1138587 RepID=A0ABM8G6X3_9CELL|nr:hypothetical protein GCM10025865_32120 [Paraoerskovia sediminicola]
MGARGPGRRQRRGTGGAAPVTAGIGPDGRLVALLEDESFRGSDVARPVIVFAPA